MKEHSQVWLCHITANILMSFIIDKFGWFGRKSYPLIPWKIFGGLLMVAGNSLLSKF